VAGKSGGRHLNLTTLAVITMLLVVLDLTIGSPVENGAGRGLSQALAMLKTGIHSKKLEVFGLLAVLQPSPADQMAAYELSQLVNSPEHNSSACMNLWRSFEQCASIATRCLGGYGEAEGDAGIVSIISCSSALVGRGSRCWRGASPPSCRR
jgi:hypothetical protein